MAVVVEETAVNNEMCKNQVSPVNCLAGTSKSGLKATKLHTKNLNKLQKTINIHKTKLNVTKAWFRCLLCHPARNWIESSASHFCAVCRNTASDQSD